MGRPTVLRAAAFAFCLLWGIAALAKLREPLVAYELVALNIGPGDAAKFVLAGVVTVEALLAAWLALGLPSVRGLWGSFAWLAALTVALVVAEGRVGGTVPCGCFPSALDADVAGALTRNGWLLAGLLALLLWEHVARFRGRDGRAGCGPATPGS